MFGDSSTVGADEDHDRKGTCDIDIGGWGEARENRDESEKVTVENKKEEGGDEWEPGEPFLSEDFHDKGLSCKLDQGFHEVLNPPWNQSPCPACQGKGQKDQKACDPDCHDSIRNGNINASDFQWDVYMGLEMLHQVHIRFLTSQFVAL
jgi:hypothetical protein